MAKFACKTIGDLTSLVDAADLTYADKGTFYCSTPDCLATMHIRNVQKACACFVSNDRNKHIDPTFCLKKDCFKPDQYDEKKFDLNEFFNVLLHSQKKDTTIKSGCSGIGGYNKIAIKTLKVLYEICLQYKDKSYNGYDIDDILAYRFNYDKYKNGIEGHRIVSCTFHCYDSDEQTVTMNYPYAGQKKIKIHVPDKQMFRKTRSKLYDPSHEIVVVIGGDWHPSRETNILSECKLHSIAKQTCRG